MDDNGRQVDIVDTRGFAILAREFARARRLLDWSKDRAGRSWIAVRNRLARLPAY